MKPVAEEDERSTCVSLFSIAGHGGVGKTTLTQLVFDDESLDKCFKSKIWVCISFPFDAKKVMKDMIEYAAGSKLEVGGLGALLEALKKLISCGKFLLVLDDAWDDDDLFAWGKLFASLRSGQRASKILLTTRKESVADMTSSALGGLISIQ
ncbi:putative disease resistance protein RGA4 [Asparagus officinalis]|uniref:putative disease resistance protein RGA4 n=1 Tax=Asparagus officinalis TaxID=4686 RepID=UPI00098E5AA9|nr:putative disease resistance protein RGA4 [Asparagus officinalis]